MTAALRLSLGPLQAHVEVRSMHLKTRRSLAVFFGLLVLLSVLLCSCENERIGEFPDGETGDFYTSEGQFGENAAYQEQFNAFCDSLFFEEMSAASTLDLHYTLLHPEIYGITPGEPTLGTYSLTEMIADNEECKVLKTRLEHFDRSLLSDNQQVLYDTLLDTLNTSLLAEGLELYEQPLAPTIGVQAQLPILLAEYSFGSVKDVEDYLSLLTQIDEYYGQILEFENQKAAAGLAPSDTSIDRIVKSCESYLIDPQENFLTETFEARLASLSETLPLTEEQFMDFRSRHLAAIREHFIPAYENLILGMTALKGRGIRDGGLCALTDGKRYYEYLLKSGTGTSYSIAELKEALSRQMEEDIDAINRLFSANPSLDIRNAAFSVSDPQKILADLQEQMADDFPDCPNCEYEIRYVPKYLEASLSPAFYLTAPADDLNQNVIYINNGYSDSTDNLYTTLAHEGFPGHLYQTIYNRSHAASPLSAILSCSGANEGWATYVENYACTLDNGLPEGVGEYRAHARSFSLCVHGLLDIGINYDGWTMEQAEKFITACFQADEETVQELWQVMIDNPTNYLEYCNGYVEIMEMRREAEAELGEQFNLKEFHRFLLDLGPVPFSVTRDYFSRWLSGAGTLDKSANFHYDKSRVQSTDKEEHA